MDVKWIRLSLYIITALTLITPIHGMAASSPRLQQTPTATSPDPLKPEVTILTNLKTLIQQHQLDRAKTVALDHLKSNPNDVDVRLFLGIIYYQQAAYQQAELAFRQVLQKVPTYLDAKIGLIRVKMAQKQYKEAAILIKEAIKQAPQNPDLKQIEISYKKAIQGEKQKKEKKAKEQPNCIDKEIANSVNSAMFMIYGCLSQYPNDKRLLTQMATVHLKRHLYAQSAYYVQQALKIDSTYVPAKEVLSTINEISPNRTFGLNEIGLTSTNEYVSDVHQNWDYSTLHLMRETWLGNLSARVNYAQRQGSRSFQGEFEFVAIINPYLNLDLYYAFANAPNLFPKNASLVEPYGTIPNFFTLSLGQYYAHILGSIGYKKSTASISRDIGSNWLLFRVNHYIPNSGPQSTLYILTARHYFGSLDFYLNLNIGYGRSPDLADLLTTNFIVIRNKFINLNLRFPVYGHRILVDIGADHQKWKYPSGLDRPLTGATLGLSYRF